MDSHSPISAPLRKHPVQYPCSSSSQTLMQGDGGRSMGLDDVTVAHTRLRLWPKRCRVELWGGVAYSSNEPSHRLRCNQNKSLDGHQGRPHEPVEQSSTVSDSRHCASGPARFGDWGTAFQPARTRPVVPYRLGRVLDRPAVLL